MLIPGDPHHLRVPPLGEALRKEARSGRVGGGDGHLLHLPGFVIRRALGADRLAVAAPEGGGAIRREAGWECERPGFPEEQAPCA
eukprot:442130-Prorocentrum_minimum.AAC.1